MRIARSLGISLRRFLGWAPWLHHTNGRIAAEAEYDATERHLWRALHDWETDRCPDCGQPYGEALWDPAIPEAERARWRAEYHQCLACHAMEEAKRRQQELDDETAARQGGKPPLTQHRKWHVHRDDVKGR